MYIIYKYTYEETNESYIGYTSKSLEERAGPNGANYLRRHGKDNRLMHPAFANAIIAHGWDAFTSEILEEVETLEEAKEREKFYIAKFDSHKHGYNCTNGGEDCQDPEIRAKAKASWHANPENEEKTRQQMIEFRKQPGFVENMMAHNWATQEQFDKAADRMRERNSDPEYQKKCQEGKAKKAAADPEYYSKIKAKTKLKLAHKVICITTGQIFSSLTDAEKEIGISRQCISMCCKGKLKTSGQLPDGTRLTWSYYKEEEKEKGGDADDEN